MSPPSLSRPRPRTLLVTASLLALSAGLLGACRSAPAEAASPDQVRPTLAEVFLIPGLHGQPPRAQSLSADGRWLLLRWSPMTASESGEREISGDDSLRILAVDDPAASDHRGQLLVELVPELVPELEQDESDESEDEGEEEQAGDRSRGRPTSAWSQSGHRLAVALERRIWLLDHDGTAWRAELAWEPPPDPVEPDPPEESDTEESDTQETGDEGDDGDEEDQAEDETGPRLRSPRNLEFRENDTILRVGSGRDVFDFRLDGILPWRLGEAHWLTEGLDASASWSDDYEVAFGRSRPLERLGVEPERAADGEDEVEDTRVPAQVWHRSGDRYVTLAGYDELDGPSASLSPDGRFVFAQVSDESEQADPTLVPNYLSTRVSTRNARRQWAEDTASPRTYHVWDTDTGEHTELELPEDEGTWLSSMGWAPNPARGPARLGLRRVSADWRTMEIWVWSEGSLRMILRERDERWYGGPGSFARWSRDGSVILLGSESTPASLTPGHSQLFALDPQTGVLRQLTEVAGELSSYTPNEDGSVTFVASGANPARRHVGVVPAGAVPGATSEELSARRTWAREWPGPPGWNDRPRASRDGSRVVFAHAELGVPAELWAADEERAWQLTETVPPEYEAIDWIRPVKFQAVHADGTRIFSHVYLPRATSIARPDRPRPCIVFIHGAGYLQNVTDSMTQYEVNMMFHSRLAELGYVVLDVDYRGSAGYGNDFRTRLQYHLGGLDLDDIHLVMGALADEGVIDGERVACYGGSYGGFLTLMALFTAPDRWVGGAALRSVTDWRTYHPRYTQPRLGRPSTHPEAFARSSPIDHSDKVEDPVLILHGMMDSNVFAQDSIRLIEQLIDQGAEFDAMLYPSQGHAFSDGMHWLDEYGRIESFLTGLLGPP